MSIRSNVDARRLDQRVDFQRVTNVQDSTGDPIPTWTTTARSVQAAVDAEKANSERPQSDGIGQGMQYTFWVRYDVWSRFGGSLTGRIIWRGLPYNISGAPDQQAPGRLIAIFATTGENSG